MLHEVDRLDTKGIEKIQFLFVFDFALQGLGEGCSRGVGNSGWDWSGSLVGERGLKFVL
jgi:hypothetical protein